jgi:hypothetical protein
MSRRVLFLLALPLHFWASSANTADDPVDALTGGGASTFPCDVMCCGFGHRFAVVWEGYDMARDLNKTLAVGWGPCRSNVSNIFGKMFTPTPYVHPSLDSFPKWQKDGCTAHGATGANPYKFPKRGLELFDTLARNVDPAMQERVHKFKAEVNWASTPVIGIYVRAGDTKSHRLHTTAYIVCVYGTLSKFTYVRTFSLVFCLASNTQGTRRAPPGSTSTGTSTAKVAGSA